MVHYRATYEPPVEGTENEWRLRTVSGDVLLVRDVLDLVGTPNLYGLEMELDLLSGDRLTLNLEKKDDQFGTWVVTAVESGKRR